MARFAAHLRENKLAYIYILPSFLVLGFVVIYPFVYSVVISFSNMSLGHFRDWKLTGFEQYLRVFREKVFNLTPIQWLSDPLGAFAAATITNIWLGSPFMMVIALGGLQSIPKELYEAAEVDGAKPWRQFWKITALFSFMSAWSEYLVAGLF